MARLYADENFPHPAVERLRELGHDVRTVQDEGKAQQKLPDEAVLADACADGRAVVTHNRKDFRYLSAPAPAETTYFSIFLSGAYSRITARLSSRGWRRWIMTVSQNTFSGRRARH
jgi:hypothetical protein